MSPILSRKIMTPRKDGIPKARAGKVDKDKIMGYLIGQVKLWEFIIKAKGKIQSIG